jgi:uncharacterized protein (DUF924 family)
MSLPDPILPTGHTPDQVLDLWFPDSGHWTTPAAHGAFWTERMQGGMDAAICARFADLTLAAATGHLDHWAATPQGRLALVIALDQFPRSLWRDTPAAYAQDIKAARLALDGIAAGDIGALAPWEAAFFVIAISHCEGPDHLERMQRLDAEVARIMSLLPPQLEGFAARFVAQHARVTEIIKTFGRHPHRNAVLGRPSSPAEMRYIEAGDFPHLPAKPA